MKQMTEIYFTVARVLALVFGILFCITIIGAILGIPLIMASNKFRDALQMRDEELVKNRGAILGWGIFLAVVFSPTFFGLIVMIILAMMVDSYIKNIEQGDYYKNERTFSETVEEGVSGAWSDIKRTFAGKSDVDKQKEELQKLQKMKDEGLINGDEYEELRKKILGL